MNALKSANHASNNKQMVEQICIAKIANAANSLKTSLECAVLRMRALHNENLMSNS